MKRIRNIITYFNDDTGTIRDVLSASILGAAGLIAAWVMMM